MRVRCRLDSRSENTVDFEGGLFSFQAGDDKRAQLVVEPAPGELSVS